MPPVAMEGSSASGTKVLGVTERSSRPLSRRFDRVPDWAEEHLEQASREELESWAERVLDAERLEDVFGSE